MNRLGTLAAIVAGLGLAFFSGPRFVGAGLTLIEGGGGARKALRYKPKFGVKEKSTLTMHLTMDGVGPRPVTGEMQGELESRLLGTAGDEYQVAADASMGMSLVVDPKSKAVAPPPTQMKFRYMLNSRGKARDFQIEPVKGAEALPPELAQHLRQTLDQLAVPWLPQEAIGVGARWVINQEVDLFGMRMAAHNVYELKALDGDRMDLAFRGTVTAKGDALALPGMPADARVSGVMLSGTATGTMTVDLTRVVPVSSKMEFALQMALSAEVAGRRRDLAAQMTMSMTIESPTPAPAESPAGGR
jgi:hypothetical protein